MEEKKDRIENNDLDDEEIKDNEDWRNYDDGFERDDPPSRRRDISPEEDAYFLQEQEREEEEFKRMASREYPKGFELFDDYFFCDLACPEFFKIMDFSKNNSSFGKYKLPCMSSGEIITVNRKEFDLIKKTIMEQANEQEKYKSFGEFLSNFLSASYNSEKAKFDKMSFLGYQLFLNRHAYPEELNIPDETKVSIYKLQLALEFFVIFYSEVFGDGWKRIYREDPYKILPTFARISAVWQAFIGTKKIQNNSDFEKARKRLKKAKISIRNAELLTGLEELTEIKKRKDAERKEQNISFRSEIDKIRKENNYKIKTAILEYIENNEKDLKTSFLNKHSGILISDWKSKTMCSLERRYFRALK